ncbi:hypothetical protein BVX98_00450, partial [bacterium F11]
MFFTVDPNNLTRLQVLMPGETADPGRPVNYGGAGEPAGKSGEPDSSGAPGTDPFVAGENYTVTVNAVDNYYNVISTDATVSLLSTDPNGTPSDTVPLVKALINGSTTFTATLKTAQDSASLPFFPVNPRTHTVSASASGLIGNTSPTLNLDPNTSTKIQILLPNETAEPGTAIGKTGSPSNATAGENYTITTRLTDDYFNAVGNAGSNVSVRLNTDDPYDSNDPDDDIISAGLGNYVNVYTHQFQTADSVGWLVHVSTYNGPSYQAALAGPIVVDPDTNPSNDHYLLVLLPGENHVPGDVANNGKSGSPDFTSALGYAVPKTGDFFPVRTIGVDRFYNRIFDATNPLVKITADSTLYPNYGSPAVFALALGSASINASIRRSTTSAYFEVYENTYGSDIDYSSGTSASFSVDPNAATQLQVLVPGETAVPGSATGKTGVPDSDGNNAQNGDGIGGNIDDFVAGVNYQVNVQAVDDYYNLVPSASADIDLVTTDPYDQPALITQPLVGGGTQYSVQFFTANAVGWTIHVSTSLGNQLTDDTSPLMPVRANSVTQLIVTVPGETHVPGDVSNNGKTGNPASAPGGTYTAGNIWIATVTAVDNWFNTVSNAIANSWFHTTDPYDVQGVTQPLVTGATTFAIQMYQAGNQTLNILNDAGLTNTSVSNIPIVAGSVNRALVILPGETHLPGKPPYTPSVGVGGKEEPDNPSPQIAGSPITVTVYGTDRYWNQANSNSLVQLTAPDDVNPDGLSNRNLVAGVTTYSVTLYKAVNSTGFAHNFVATVGGFTNPTYITPELTLYPDTVG